LLNFNYYNPSRIFFGKDRLGELDNQVPKDAKVLMLYGGGSAKKYGTLDKVKANLGKRTVLEFGGIQPNPRYDTMIKAVKIVREEGINFLLAVGGGSVMDGTKFVALAAEYRGNNAADLLLDESSHSRISKVIPLGTVVTLPATGSEMNSGGVINYEDGKLVFANPLIFPRFSIIDPTLSFTLPKIQIANGVIDTFIHTTDEYLTYPAEGRFQDRAAEGLLMTLIEIGKKTLDNPTDYDARANLMWCSSMALANIISVGVPRDFTSHMLGHELTAMFGIDHAQTLAVIAPSVWTIMKEPKRGKLLQCAERVWDITRGSEDQRIDEAIDKTRKFFESLGVKTHLSDYGVTADKINNLVRALEKHGQTKLGEHGTVTLEISRKIYENAM
jgi:NADP-dependent alcohol dehydrogenase